MAEFCLRCMNKMDGTSLTKEDVILEFALCEECSKVMPCVVRYRTWPERVIRICKNTVIWIAATTRKILIKSI